MIIWLQISYIIGLLPLAWYNARRIKKNQRIYHALNCFYHFPAWAAIVYFSSWEVVFVLPLAGKLFFDLFLNAMRGLPINYLPAKPKSWMDKAEKKFFFNDGYFAKATYLAVIIALNLFYYGNKEGF